MSKKDVMKELRRHLAEVFDARYEGAMAVDLARSQGFADGYMQALHDLALVEDRELLDVVNAERRSSVHRADAAVIAVPTRPAVELA